MTGLTDGEITRVVNRYIGVSGGYLEAVALTLNNRPHSDFYPVELAQ